MLSQKQVRKICYATIVNATGPQGEPAGRDCLAFRISLLRLTTFLRIRREEFYDKESNGAMGSQLYGFQPRDRDSVCCGPVGKKTIDIMVQRGVLAQ